MTIHVKVSVQHGEDIIEKVDGAYLRDPKSCPGTEAGWESRDDSVELLGTVTKSTEYIYCVNKGVAHAGWYCFDEAYTSKDRAREMAKAYSSKNAGAYFLDNQIPDGLVVAIKIHDLPAYLAEIDNLKSSSNPPSMESDIELA